LGNIIGGLLPVDPRCQLLVDAVSLRYQMAPASEPLAVPGSSKELRNWFLSENITVEELSRMWLALDKNEATIAEIKALTEKDDITELERRLRKRIEFGTAGI